MRFGCNCVLAAGPGSGARRAACASSPLRWRRHTRNARSADERIINTTARLITAARRDYLLTIQHGQPTGRVIAVSDLPAKDAALAGFLWLPRQIAKARAKLAGEMPADLMYCCGGDRAFFKRVKCHPADFLRVVWAAHDDDQKIIAYIRQCAGGR